MRWSPAGSACAAGSTRSWPDGPTPTPPSSASGRTTPPSTSPTTSSPPRSPGTPGSASGRAQRSGGPPLAERAGGRQAADAERLRAANPTYEHRFGHVFLVRAAGRTSAEILAELRRRLYNDEEAERAETVTALRDIALLRLEGVVR